MPRFLKQLSLSRISLKGATVDAQSHVIRGISIIQEGEALGHGFMVDKVMLAQVLADMSGQPKGVKSRLTHPGMSDCGGYDGIEVTLGRIKATGMSPDGTKVIGDAYLADYATKTPAGDVRSFLESVVEEDSEVCGISIVSNIEMEEQPDDAEGNPQLPLGRIPAGGRQVMAADFVGDPAANRDGLMAKILPLANVNLSAITVAQLIEHFTGKKLSGDLPQKTETEKTTMKFNLAQLAALVALGMIQAATAEQAEAFYKMLNAESQAKVNSAGLTAPAPTETAEQLAAKAETKRRETLKELSEMAEVGGAPMEKGWLQLQITSNATVDEARKAVVAQLGQAKEPFAPAAHIHGGTDRRARVHEAALCLTARLPDIEKHFQPEELDAARRGFKGGVGLQEMLMEHAQLNGWTGKRFRGNHKDIMAYAFRTSLGSTSSISGILGNVANKFLLAGFTSTEMTWRKFCAIRNVNDFKTITSYRLTGDSQYEKVAPDGRIKHGTLTEESYTNKADTYGKLVAVSRTDIINDDLGALTSGPQQRLGRGAGLKINDVFWAAWAADTNFFKTDNSYLNYISGATTNLSIATLTTLEQMFMDQVDENGKPLGIQPRFLLVPTALSALAAQLMKSTEIRDTTASTKYGTSNPHAGKFEVLVSAYMGNASYGNSATAFNLIADPAALPAIEVAFLNGNESPTIETVEMDAEQLGFVIRGYHDFGASLQDPRAANKTKGAA